MNLPRTNKIAGFSLTETLIVLGIIGVLTSVALAATNVSRSKARDTKRLSDIKEIQLGLAIYYDVNKTYPATGNLSVLVTQKYLPEIPTDPQGGVSYEYALVGTTSYCLGATLEDTSLNPGDSSSCSTGGTANYKVAPPQ